MYELRRKRDAPDAALFQPNQESIQIRSRKYCLLVEVVGEGGRLAPGASLLLQESEMDVSVSNVGSG
ncbi:MAG: hypothetical protein AAGG01_01065, partial [Planctomycetota bacterium]